MQIRKNIRLKEYDYSTKGMYFVTICTREMNYIFGNIDEDKMLLNDFGNTVNHIIKDFRNDNYEIIFYQIMPNHLHYIIELKNDGKVQLGKTVAMLKGKCSYELKIKDMWQKGYYERVVRDENEYNRIVKYINENPYRDKYNW